MAFSVTLCQPEQLESDHLKALEGKKDGEFALEKPQCIHHGLSHVVKVNKWPFSYFSLQLKLYVWEYIENTSVCGLPELLGGLSAN